MSPSRWFSVVLTWWCITVATGAQAVERYGLSDYDRVLLCARAAFGKPVIGFEDWPRIDDVKCVETVEGMREAFKAKGLRVLELKDWVYLIPEVQFDLSFPSTPRPLPWAKPISWKHLEIVTKIENFRLNPGSRQLTSEEENVISKDVLRSIRMVPQYIGSKADQSDIYGPPSPDGETAIMEMTLWLDAHRLAPSVPESVVAFLAKGMYGGYERLAYGEIHDGRYQMLWDSPMFHGANLALGYSDVDGDGVQEIVVSNWYGGGRAESLSIFGRTGVELTRRDGCDGFVLEAAMESRYGGQAAAVCPIVGAEITIDDPVNGKRDLIVREYTAEKPRTLRYRLQAGHYVKVAPARSHPASKAARPK